MYSQLQLTESAVVQKVSDYLRSQEQASFVLLKPARLVAVHALPLAVIEA